MKVRVIQLLCPSRHCIVAAAYESEDGNEQPGQLEDLKGQVARIKINPWCGICGSNDLKYEDKPTRFSTMAEAEPHLKCAECSNILSRMALDEIGATVDSIHRHQKIMEN